MACLSSVCCRQVIARIQGKPDEDEDEDSKQVKRSFKAELRDALTVVRHMHVLYACWQLMRHTRHLAPSCVSNYYQA